MATIFITPGWLAKEAAYRLHQRLGIPLGLRISCYGTGTFGYIWNEVFMESEVPLPRYEITVDYAVIMELSMIGDIDLASQWARARVNNGVPLFSRPEGHAQLEEARQIDVKKWGASYGA